MEGPARLSVKSGPSTGPHALGNRARDPSHLPVPPQLGEHRAEWLEPRMKPGRRNETQGSRRQWQSLQELILCVATGTGTLFPSSLSFPCPRRSRHQGPVSHAEALAQARPEVGGEAQREAESLG